MGLRPGSLRERPVFLVPFVMQVCREVARVGVERPKFSRELGACQGYDVCLYAFQATSFQALLAEKVTQV